MGCGDISRGPELLSNGRINPIPGVKEAQAMELYAMIHALQYLASEELRHDRVMIYTDCRNLVTGISALLPKWIQRNWMNCQNRPLGFAEQWKRIAHLMAMLKSKHIEIQVCKVRAHSGNPRNNACDRIARRFSRTKYFNVPRGPWQSSPA